MRTSLLLLSFLIATAPQAQYENAVDFSSVLKFTYEDHHSGLRYGRLRSNAGYGNIRFDVWLPNGTSDVRAGEMAVLYPDGSPIAVATMTTLNTTALSSIFVLGGSDEDWYTTLESDIEYRYTLSMGDDLLIDFPFTASVSGGDDPYVTSGDKEWALESGPWFTHSLIQQDEDGLQRYFMWLKVEDASIPGEKSYDFEVSIRRDGQEVAWGKHDSSGYMRYFNLRTAASRHESGEFGRAQSSEWWLASDVTLGTYEVVVTREDGKVVSEQTIEGGDGTFVPHPRSALDYQPRSRFLTPVRAGSLGGGNNGDQYNLFWIAPEE